MNAMTPDPAAVLARLHAETKAMVDATPSADTAADVLSNRVRAIEDVLFTLAADHPAALRIQADAIRVYVRDFQHESTVAAIMTLAATYADRLAGQDATPAPVRPSFVRLCDTSMHLLDALGAVNMAVDGVDDEAQVRSLRFLVEKVQDIAGEIDDMARSLHHGAPTTDDSRDADLRNTITAWRVVEERVAETDNDPEHVERSHRLLAKIAETEAQTVRGALAKARICYDDHEIEREMQDGAPIERVGASGLRDLFRFTGEA